MGTIIIFISLFASAMIVFFAFFPVKVTWWNCRSQEDFIPVSKPSSRRQIHEIDEIYDDPEL